METRYLYRAKRLDNGEWVYGCLFCCWERRYILWGMTNGVPNMVEVDKASVCQCTGLTDRYGTLIFEKDILSGLELVLWMENGWYKEPKNDNPYELEEYDCKEETVIGNKFDNPELLEV